MRLKLRLARSPLARVAPRVVFNKTVTVCVVVGSLGGQSCRARDAAGRSEKALITHAGNLKINPVTAARARRVIDDVLAEHEPSR
jgi:hypothetical protein